MNIPGDAMQALNAALIAREISQNQGKSAIATSTSPLQFSLRPPAPTPPFALAEARGIPESRLSHEPGTEIRSDQDYQISNAARHGLGTLTRRSGRRGGVSQEYVGTIADSLESQVPIEELPFLTTESSPAVVPTGIPRIIHPDEEGGWQARNPGDWGPPEVEFVATNVQLFNGLWLTLRGRLIAAFQAIWHVDLCDTWAASCLNFFSAELDQLDKAIGDAANSGGDASRLTEKRTAVKSAKNTIEFCHENNSDKLGKLRADLKGMSKLIFEEVKRMRELLRDAVKSSGGQAGAAADADGVPEEIMDGEGVEEAVANGKEWPKKAAIDDADTMRSQNCDMLKSAIAGFKFKLSYWDDVKKALEDLGEALVAARTSTNAELIGLTRGDDVSDGIVRRKLGILNGITNILLQAVKSGTQLPGLIGPIGYGTREWIPLIETEMGNLNACMDSLKKLEVSMKC